MHSRFVIATHVLAALATFSVQGATASWSLTAAKSGTNVTLAQTAPPPALTDGDELDVTVSCTGVICSTEFGLLFVTSAGQTAMVRASGATAASATFTGIVSASTTSVIGKYSPSAGGAASTTASIALGTIAPKPPGATTASSVADAINLSLQCPAPSDVPTDGQYDQDKNSATVFIRPNGSLIGGMTTQFDENDSLLVEVVVHKSLVPYLHVIRASTFRTVGNSSILGQDSNLAGTGIVKQGTAPVVLASDCVNYPVVLRDFAPGRGVVEVHASSGGQETTIGSMEFAVHQLYTGMFTLGPVWTRAVDQSPKIVTNAQGAQVVGPSNEGQGTMVWGLFFTPFVWGQRDIEKSYVWYQHLNPSIGLDLNNITSHGFVGVSADLFDGIALTVGGDIGVTTELNSASGLQIGGQVPAGLTALPTSNKFTASWMFAATIDVRAAVSLLKVAATAVSSTATAGSK